MQFTLPLAENNNYPFRLTEDDKGRSNDNWAWSFLRLNPYYRHDFNLVLTQPDVQPHLDEAKRLIFRFRMKTLPAEYASIRHPTALLTLPTELPKAVADLDSRYFMFNGEPLAPPRKHFSSEPATLQGWLNKQGGIANIAHLNIRDIDAPRDYGIAAWVHPDKQTLEELPPDASWFHFINEPVWSVGTWALRPSNVLRMHTTASGRKIMVGTEERTVVVKEVTERHAPDFEGTVKQLVVGRPIPLMYGSKKSTVLYFLICLDGYIETQLKSVRPIADDLKALHRAYFPKAIARGSLPNFVPIIENPHDPSTQLTAPLSGLFKSLTQAPTRNRRHWRAITIDVAAPMVEQFDYVTDRLLEVQDTLAAQLTFPLRKRTGRTDGDHWLKKNLSVLELYFNGFDGESLRPSLLAMTRAFYDEDDPMYLAIRGKSTAQSSEKSWIGASALHADHPKLEVIKEALANAQDLALGWYEFVAWPGTHSKT
jgi:hypothetical protein